MYYMVFICALSPNFPKHEYNEGKGDTHISVTVKSDGWGCVTGNALEPGSVAVDSPTG